MHGTNIKIRNTVYTIILQVNPSWLRKQNSYSYIPAFLHLSLHFKYRAHNYAVLAIFYISFYKKEFICSTISL